MCHRRTCASCITWPFFLGGGSVYKLEDGLVRRGDNKDEIDYRDLVNRTATMSPPHNH